MPRVYFWLTVFLSAVVGYAVAHAFGDNVWLGLAAGVSIYILAPIHPGGR